MSKCQDNMRHYEVIAPEITTYEYFDGFEGNPEPYYCWVELLAHNAKEAVALAVKHPDFKEWVSEARSDGINPYQGVKAKLFRCDHGTCLGCEDECPLCIAEYETHEALSSGDGVEVQK